MSITDGPARSAWLRTLRDSLRDVLSTGDRTDVGQVIEVRGAGPSQRAELVENLEADYDRQVFQMAASDLVAPPHERAAAALRLLDAALAAGAIPMLDAVDDLVPDRAAIVALEDRLRDFPGVVVLSNEEPSKLRRVVDQAIRPE